MTEPIHEAVDTDEFDHTDEFDDADESGQEVGGLGDDEPDDDEPDDDEPDDDEPDDDEPDDDEPDGNRVVGGVSRSVLDFVVRSIVDDADAVAIDADVRGNRVDFSVTVAQADMGKVIGRRGHVVQAIRTLVRAAGATEGVEASVEVVD
ncbi:MAG: KH domain-containing protein [Acidimicrobiales bacterium]